MNPKLKYELRRYLSDPKARCELIRYLSDPKNLRYEIEKYSSNSELRYELGRHLSDSTAIITLYTPISSAVETIAAGMTDIRSMRSRGILTLLTYGGLGSLTKLRDWSKAQFGIKEEDGLGINLLHDALFAGTFTLMIKPTVYLLSGETDWRKIAIGTAGITALNFLLGGPFGYFTDLFRDVTGVKESERTPKWIKRNPSLKKYIIPSLLTLSITATGLVYYFTPEKKETPSHQQPKQEAIVPSNSHLEEKVLE